MTPENKWKWFGHAGHFCGGNSCRFHLCTKVGKYLISSVGDYYCNDKRKTLGAGDDSFFETYVFRVTYGVKCTNKTCNCKLPNIDLSEIEGIRTATAGAAAKTHMAMCQKYSKRVVK